MFRCDRCLENSAMGAKPHVVVAKKRVRKYDTGNGYFTEGTEVVREERLCASCALGKFATIQAQG